MAGRAEALPFSDGRVDLVTTAGALNYADVEMSLSEISRVLRPAGLLVAYDFSAGRRLRDDVRLGDWHDAFLARFPSPPGYALDLRHLNYGDHGLTLGGYDALEVALPMSLNAYVNYMLREARVERAIAEGRAEADIRREVESDLRPIFDDVVRDVIFDAEIAWGTRDRREVR